METKKVYKKISIALFVLWFVLMCFMLFAPNNLLVQKRTSLFNIPYSDKIVHCMLFCGFTYLFHLCVCLNANLKPKKLYLISICVALGFGLLSEIIQALTFEWCGRRMEVADYVSDLLGAGIALLFFKISKKKLKKILQC